MIEIFHSYAAMEWNEDLPAVILAIFLFAPSPLPYLTPPTLTSHL